MKHTVLVALIAACMPPSSTSTTASPMLSTSDSSSGSEGSGVQTATSNTPTSTDSPGTSGSTSTTDLTSQGPTTEPVTSSTGPMGECGNGVVELGEECDDGNDNDFDQCTQVCKPPGCGDGVVHPGEDCDDGNVDNDDGCTQACAAPFCGDGYVSSGEDCDDGNDEETDACLNSCEVASCGDGKVHDGVEACDDGFNDGDYNGCMPGCGERGPHCGDGELYKVDINKPKGFEYCDGNVPYMGVGCTDGCLYDFSQVPQLYCISSCSWAGPQGCDQADADLFCRLRTGNPNAKAKSFTLGVPTEEGGFPCLDSNAPVLIDDKDPRIFLGPLPEYGVGVDALFILTKMKTAHGGAVPNSVIVGASLVCE